MRVLKEIECSEQENRSYHKLTSISHSSIASRTNRSSLLPSPPILYALLILFEAELSVEKRTKYLILRGAIQLKSY